MRRPNRKGESARQRRRRSRRQEDQQVQRWVAREEGRAANEAERTQMLADLKARCLPDEEIERILAVAKAPRVEREGRRGGKRPTVKHKDLDRYVKLAWEAGWRVELGGIEHLKLFSPGGEIVSVPSSPSRQRTVRRIRSALRRNGLDL